MQDVERTKSAFLAIWTIAIVIKVVIASRLPLFVDEAFYWQEGQHLAAAYSDLPGLTAWLTRLGTALGGQHVLAVRAPFLLMAACLPWLIAGIARRWYDEAAGWQAGMLTVLMPLSSTLGVMALPDVPMALAAVLCLDAGARLLREVHPFAVAELALGLAMGALSHYRFVGVIGVGLLALLMLPEGRRVLRTPAVWIALAIGMAAWGPLIGWNLLHADAGLRFQLVDRHPWSFQQTGVRFLLLQPLMVTPLLFVALMMTAAGALRRDAEALPQWRYFAWLGGFSTLAFFLLGFFADVERVSFHWTLPGYLALLIGVPMILRRWSRAWRLLAWILTTLGVIGMLGYYLVASTPQWRERVAGSKHYPYNFAGWDQLAERVQAARAKMPPDTVVLADNFKLGAELGFHLGDADIRVLDHPLNHKHGRAPQLRLWGLHHDALPAQPTLLVASSTDVKLRDLLAHYQSLCARLGSLPAPEVVNIDRGAQRVLLFAFDGPRPGGGCVTPAIAHINTPQAGATVGPRFEVQGWAIKDGSGVSRVHVTLDGKPVAEARYGGMNEWLLQDFYANRSRDPNRPRVAFRAQVELDAAVRGEHWLGLEIIGADGSRERWSEQRIRVE